MLERERKIKPTFQKAVVDNLGVHVFVKESQAVGGPELVDQGKAYLILFFVCLFSFFKHESFQNIQSKHSGIPKPSLLCHQS